MFKVCQASSRIPFSAIASSKCHFAGKSRSYFTNSRYPLDKERSLDAFYEGFFFFGLAGTVGAGLYGLDQLKKRDLPEPVKFVAVLPVTVGSAAVGGALIGTIGGLAVAILVRHPIISVSAILTTYCKTPNPPAKEQSPEKK
ncbi:MAG: hypothetical protein V4489_05175 [Chlamydiota bacterium]